MDRSLEVCGDQPLSIIGRPLEFLHQDAPNLCIDLQRCCERMPTQNLLDRPDRRRVPSAELKGRDPHVRVDNNNHERAWAAAASSSARISARTSATKRGMSSSVYPCGFRVAA